MVPTPSSRLRLELARVSSLTWIIYDCRLLEAIERFFYDRELNCCFAFKYTGAGGNGNRYATRSACSQTCAPMGIGMCNRFPNATRQTSSTNSSATDVLCGNEAFCPAGFECRASPFSHYHCYNSTIGGMVTSAYDATCPGGEPARGTQQEGYFAASFGKKCEEMVCGEGEKCQQVNQLFAKCCKSMKNSA